MRAHNREASVITAVHADLILDSQKALEVPKSIWTLCSNIINGKSVLVDFH